MAKLMPNPWKHPKTGVYYLRLRVPEDLHPYLRKREYKKSLRTKNLSEAKIRFAILHAETLSRWAKLKEGKQRLTDRQIVALSGDIYRAALVKWDERPEEMSAAYALRGLLIDNALQQLTPSGKPRTANMIGWPLEELISNEVDEALAPHGLALEPESRERLMKRSADALVQAYGQASREALGHYQPDPHANRFPPFEPPHSNQLATRTKIDSDYKAYLDRLTDVAKSTLKRWSSILRKLMESARKSDLRAITSDDIETWMSASLASGRMTPRTFKENDLVAIKAIFNRAISDKILVRSPAADVKLRVSKRDKGRDMRGFFDDEATIILRATLASPPKRLAPHHAAARRWVPWLCAYTGARVNEITQLRACDIKHLEKHWCILITPEAGTQKTLSKRWVPLHEHLIEQGFLDFVNTKRGVTPLFTAAKSGEDRKTSLSELTGAHLAKWVRSLGITDPDVAPNHGWRHRFKTDARNCIPADARNAIQGHAPATAGDEYGDFPPRILGPEMAKFPRIELVGSPIRGELRHKARE